MQLEFPLFIYLPSRHVPLCTSRIHIFTNHHTPIEASRESRPIDRQKRTHVIDSSVLSSRRVGGLHIPLLHNFLVRLDLIADLEIGPGVEGHAALGTLAHFRDVLLDVLEGGKCACDCVPEVSTKLRSALSYLKDVFGEEERTRS